MRYLWHLLKEKFPGEHIRITESYTTDEVFNTECHYSIRVGSACKEFKNFYNFEQFVLKMVGEE